LCVAGGNHFSFFNFLEAFLIRKEGRKDYPQGKKHDLLLIRDFADCAKEDITVNLVPKLLVFLLCSLVGLFDKSEVLHE